jgi:hypothetical protein
MKSTPAWLLTAALSLSIACSGLEDEPELGDEFAGADPGGETIVRWSSNNFAILTTLDNGSSSGVRIIRELAMAHIAMHDAANAVERKFDSYTFTGSDALADPALAAAAAAHDVLVAVRPGKAAQIDGFLQTDLDRVTDPDTRQRSLDIGAGAASAIIAERDGDGFFDSVPYTFGPPDPGVYQPTPPGGTAVVNTQLPGVTPFALSSTDQFRPAAPPPLPSTTWRDAYNQVKDLGRSDSTTRTADQTNAALFWREQAQFTFNTIARTVATANDKGLWGTARAFALVNIALVDATLAVFETKYHYNYWRPYTAIREIDDGRSDTEMDPAWQPLNSTPPHPEYNSAQAVIGAAVATPLGKIYGKGVGFTITSSTADPPGSTRTFSSFDHVVAESSDSRIWAGIHFGFSTGSVARNQGKQIGTFIYDNLLKP